MARIAVVTDIHYGFDRLGRAGEQAGNLVEGFIDSAHAFEADFMVSLGDHVNRLNRESDAAHMRNLRAHFHRAAMPLYSLIGNNDAAHLSVQENSEIMGFPESGSYILDTEDHHLVFWNPDLADYCDMGLILCPDDVNWLAEDLRKADKPTILFSHVPLDNQSTEVEELDEGGLPRHWTAYSPQQAGEVRKILEESSVVLCLAGHAHVDRHQEIGGIHYVTHQSLVERNEEGVPIGAFSLIEAKRDSIVIHGKGLNRPSYDLTLRIP